MKPRVVSFGEIMLRLSAPGLGPILNTPHLEACFGGAEANVAVALASWKVPAAFVTCLPEDHPIADAAVAELERLGVDTSLISRGPGRMGLLFYEMTGEPPRSHGVYDRAESAISLAKSGCFDWSKVFRGCQWFHLTGVTPAISASAADLSFEAIREARRMGLTVSFDLNYREKLWRWGGSAVGVLSEIAGMADVLIGNTGHLQMVLGAPEPRGEALAIRALEAFGKLEGVAITRRGDRSGRSTWSAGFHDGKQFLETAEYEISNGEGRLGAGDSFAAGLIFGLLQSWTSKETFEFAAAACRLKHSIPGDFCRSTVDEIRALI